MFILSTDLEAKDKRWLQRKTAFRSWDTMWRYPATVIDVFLFVLKIRLDVDHPDVCKGEIRSIDSSDCKLIDSNKHHELILPYNRRRDY